MNAYIYDAAGAQFARKCMRKTRKLSRMRSHTVYLSLSMKRGREEHRTQRMLQRFCPYADKSASMKVSSLFPVACNAYLTCLNNLRFCNVL